MLSLGKTRKSTHGIYFDHFLQLLKNVQLSQNKNSIKKSQSSLNMYDKFHPFYILL